MNEMRNTKKMRCPYQTVRSYIFFFFFSKEKMEFTYNNQQDCFLSYSNDNPARWLLRSLDPFLLGSHKHVSFPRVSFLCLTVAHDKTHKYGYSSNKEFYSPHHVSFSRVSFLCYGCLFKLRISEKTCGLKWENITSKVRALRNLPRNRLRNLPREMINDMHEYKQATSNQPFVIWSNRSNEEQWSFSKTCSAQQTSPKSAQIEVFLQNHRTRCTLMVYLSFGRRKWTEISEKRPPFRCTCLPCAAKVCCWIFSQLGNFFLKSHDLLLVEPFGLGTEILKGVMCHLVLFGGGWTYRVQRNFIRRDVRAGEMLRILEKSENDENVKINSAACWRKSMCTNMTLTIQCS